MFFYCTAPVVRVDSPAVPILHNFLSHRKFNMYNLPTSTGTIILYEYKTKFSMRVLVLYYLVDLNLVGLYSDDPRLKRVI